MSSCESLFLEAWRSGVRLSVNGSKLHLEGPSRPPDDLLERLKENKPRLLRFLSCWIDTPYGQAKFWGFLDGTKCGVVLRDRPDLVTWIRRSQLGVKADQDDRAVLVQ